MSLKRFIQRPARASSSVPRAIRYRERFEFALALSLLVHALIIALRFGSAGFGLPWFDQEERPPQRPQLSLRMSETLRAPEPGPEAASTSPEAAAAALKAKSAAPQRLTSLEVRLVPAAPPAAPAAPAAAPQREARKPAPAAKARARERKVRPKPAPRMLAQTKPNPEAFKVPQQRRPDPEPQRAPESAAKAQPEEQRPSEQKVAEQERRAAEEASKLEAEEAARARAEEEARQRAVAQKELEAKKIAEAKRLEDAKKEEEARRQALELEARKLAEEKARQEAEELARQRAVALQKEQEAKKLEEALRVEEARRQEEARKQAALKKEEEEGRRIRIEMEALKRAEELARLQAEAKRKEQEAKRLADEAAARAKEQADRARADAEAAAARERDLAAKKGPAAPGTLSGLDIARKALEDLRSPGALRGDPARPPSPGAVVEKPRRRSVIGVERDVSLKMYVDSWRWKIERGGGMNYRASASMRARDNPIVTVAIRSDGTLEEVRINRSSGVRELDQAVRRIAELNAPYSRFPPDLARQYDVIEIRRVWFFDDTLKILDEM